MNIKKVRISCGVKNCRCNESYMISRSREAGATVIICGSCLKEAYEQIYGGEKKTAQKRKTTAKGPAHGKKETEE